MLEVERIIKDLCPDGVTYVTIEEICNISRGQVMSKDYIRDNQGDYPVYSSQTENDGELGRIATYMYDGEYLTWTTDGANAGAVFYRNGKFSVTNVCGLLQVNSEKMLTKFLYYALSITTSKHVNKGMGNPKLMSNVMARIRVPLPPLAAQCEIVRVLDNFTLLSQELAAELAARKAQYEYYRDSLFDTVSDKSLITEIAFTYIGLVTTMTKHYVPQGVRLIHNSSIKENFFTFKEDVYLDEDFANQNNSRRHKINDVITVHTGDVGTSAIIDEELEGSLGFATIVSRIYDTNRIIPQYLCYYLNSKQNKRNIESLIKGDRNNLNLKDFNKLNIPIPPIEEQKRIVGILDKFSKIINDISDGLPAEIEARQKQYEYYREKLLTFKKLS